ncbi:30S ribosomal protein S10, chloroplastic-like [Camellia sinensis]|uniref:30S ribosomal protein S10, chloroplastic-like n=1 Tax=Camellia sinensis TaxID=4442 RepID=UPI001035952F|nr:30S ribosomal protein S10, chloroplastic-like [Camellia sinensis]
MTSGSKQSGAPWTPKITLEDKPVLSTDSADNINVGVALSTALLLPGDLERNVGFSEYENYALMLQHSVQVSPSSSNFSAIAVKPKLSLLSLPSTDTPLKALKPSRSSTIRVFAAPEVLDSQETIDGPDSSAPEVGGLVVSGSSPLSIGADAEKMAPKQKIRIKLRSYWV